MVEHVFVLVLENRAFDHMLGFSGIEGTDAQSGQPTRINGLHGSESNSYNGATYTVQRGADWVMPVDPGHEFVDVLEQLCGPGASYPSGGAYPAINCSGFVASYAASCAADQKPGEDPGEIMKCYTPGQLPVLTALATEFVICDNWHASMPGPTWPNRMFVHAASAAGLDHSPTKAEIVLWETIGFNLPQGTIFDSLKRKSIPWRVYGGDDFPMVAALRGIGLADVRPYHYFLQDVQGNYPYGYTFIEPSYHVTADYKCSTSQHPLDDITRGEALIKCTYEAIRNSLLWASSLLIITWDEHGGFYDHAIPPKAIPPGDTVPGAGHNQYGFTFEQYGPRVPAVVISPLIARNLIDHRIYDHASIPATVEALFGLPPLTNRDKAANHLLRLVTLSKPRDDTPAALPAPAESGVTGCPPLSCTDTDLMAAARPIPPLSNPTASVDKGNLPGVIHAAMRQDIALSPEKREKILARVGSLKTRGEAAAYLDEVRQKVRAARAAAPPPS